MRLTDELIFNQLEGNYDAGENVMMQRRKIAIQITLAFIAIIDLSPISKKRVEQQTNLQHIACIHNKTVA